MVAQAREGTAAAGPRRFAGSDPHKMQSGHVDLDPLFDGQVDYLIRMIRIRQIRAIESLLRPLNLPLSSWYPLAVLRELDGLSQRELGSRLNLKDAAIGKAVDAMQKLGLVDRVVGSDRRKALVFLTESGRTIADDVAAKRQELLRTMLRDLSDRDVEQFSDFLERAYTSIDKFVEDMPAD